MAIDRGSGEELRWELSEQEVGVAHARCDHANDDFVRVGLTQLEFLDRERAMAVP